MPCVRSLIVVGLVSACSSHQPTPLPALTGTVELTSTQSLSPTLPRQSASGPDPATSLQDYQNYANHGDGMIAEAAGDGYVSRSLDGTTPPAPGPNAARIARFAHVADLQIADDESPTRLGIFDAPAVTDGAIRTQDPDLCRMANAVVRTVNALHRQDPLSFVLLGGDLADSAQSNEVDWALSVLSGAAQVKCDSGVSNDLIPGPNNDGKDAFVAEGLAMPYKWITGNHDVLVAGDFAITDYLSTVLGTTASFGTRDYAQPGGPIRAGNFVVADSRRQLLNRYQLMAKVAADGDGHGIGETQKALGKAIYTYDLPGTSLRLLALDTAAETGGAEGIIHQADIDAVIKPALDAALQEGKLVFLASHHPIATLTLDGGTFGTVQADAVSADDWVDFIGGYPNVIFSLVGHTHQHQIAPIVPTSGHAWWEVTTASIADYPHQFRIVELFDEDNGWLMLRGTVVDFSTQNDPVGLDGRRRGAIDWQSGWGMDNGYGTALDRNVELWLRKPSLGR